MQFSDFSPNYINPINVVNMSDEYYIVYYFGRSINNGLAAERFYSTIDILITEHITRSLYHGKDCLSLK